MKEAHISAISGLIGVLVGGGITTGTSYWLMTRQETVVAAREERSRTNEIRIAVRLVANELIEFQESMRLRILEGRWTDSELRLDAWGRYKEVLARELSMDDWHQIELTFFEIETFRLTLDRLGIGNDLTEQQVEVVTEFFDNIVHDLAMLSKYDSNVSLVSP